MTIAPTGMDELRRRQKEAQQEQVGVAVDLVGGAKVSGSDQKFHDAAEKAFKAAQEKYGTEAVAKMTQALDEAVKGKKVDPETAAIYKEAIQKSDGDSKKFADSLLLRRDDLSDLAQKTGGPGMAGQDPGNMMLAMFLAVFAKLFGVDTKQFGFEMPGQQQTQHAGNKPPKADKPFVGPPEPEKPHMTPQQIEAATGKPAAPEVAVAKPIRADGAEVVTDLGAQGRRINADTGAGALPPMPPPAVPAEPAAPTAHAPELDRKGMIHYLINNGKTPEQTQEIMARQDAWEKATDGRSRISPFQEEQFKIIAANRPTAPAPDSLTVAAQGMPERPLRFGDNDMAILAEHGVQPTLQTAADPLAQIGLNTAGLTYVGEMAAVRPKTLVIDGDNVELVVQDLMARDSLKAGKDEGFSVDVAQNGPLGGQTFASSTFDGYDAAEARHAKLDPTMNFDTMPKPWLTDPNWKPEDVPGITPDQVEYLKTLNKFILEGDGAQQPKEDWTLRGQAPAALSLNTGALAIVPSTGIVGRSLEEKDQLTAVFGAAMNPPILDLKDPKITQVGPAFEQVAKNDTTFKITA